MKVARARTGPRAPNQNGAFPFMRMKSILVILAAVSFAMLFYTFSLGWRYHYGKRSLDAREDAGEIVTQSEKDAVGDLIPRHFVWGMITGIMVALTHSVVLTYFVGTGKSIKEQIELGVVPQSEHDRWRKHMGHSIAPTSLGILLAIVAAFSGGFAMIRAVPPWVHLALAVVGIVGQIPIIIYELIVIGENGRLLDDVIERTGGGDIRMTL